MDLDRDEPEAGPWRIVSLVELAELVTAPADGRPWIVAVDGRSASGKTTVARRLSEVVPGSAVVHTDDIAWWHSMFDWSELMVDGVLDPVRRGESVSFRPPAWYARGRPGAVTVPKNISVLFVEGVGAGRRETAHLVDAVIWVQSDRDIRERREAARIAAGESDTDLLERWMSEEVPFVADQRPWESACIVVSGTPDEPHDPDSQAVVADPDPLSRGLRGPARPRRGGR